MPAIRNRIKEHRRVRAGDLVPHEYNFRLHSAAQRGALQALYHEVGFARSLLAYELPDGRLKLIDGHLRRDMDPDMEVEVEVLDVNEAEARALLLSIDPLAALAETQAEVHQELLKLTPASSPELEAVWKAALDEGIKPEEEEPPARMLPEQFLVLVQCRDERQQAELLERFTADGLECKALIG
ncbi:MAG TPA: hypothetical protein VFA18_01290 [Gemmataceae bacterium]|nr:hypothetical protein [Gemmataceae bacterium]